MSINITVLLRCALPVLDIDMMMLWPLPKPERLHLGTVAYRPRLSKSAAIPWCTLLDLAADKASVFSGAKCDKIAIKILRAQRNTKCINVVVLRVGVGPRVRRCDNQHLAGGCSGYSGYRWGLCTRQSVKKEAEFESRRLHSCLHHVSLPNKNIRRNKKGHFNCQILKNFAVILTELPENHIPAE